MVRTPTPVALMVPDVLVTPNEPAPPRSGDVEMAAGHVSVHQAPRATVVVGSSRWRTAACVAPILGCFVVLVAVLAYGTVKNIVHHGRVIEDFDNWTLARLEKQASPAAVRTTTAAATVTVSTPTSDAATFEEHSGGDALANHTHFVPV
ncbi:hypothetical protein MRX96_037726 [Rhipicephalus microplus]